MKRVLFKVIVPVVFIAVWMLTCYRYAIKQKALTGFYMDYCRVPVWYPPDVPVADTEEFRHQWEHWCSCSELYHRRFNRRCSADFQDNWHCRRAYQYCNRTLLDRKVQKWKYRTSGHFVQRWSSQNMAALLLLEGRSAKRYMESMRDVDRVMEREIKKGSTPLQFEQLGFGDYSYNEITSKEKLLQVLSYLLRIGEYEPFAGKTIGNNVYMDMRGKKAVFKRPD